MNLQIALLTVGALGVVLVLLLFLVYRRFTMERRLSQRVREIDGYVQEYRQRIELIIPHAGDYMNSLGAEGNGLLDEIRRRVSLIDELTQEVGSLLATRDLGAMHEAELLLDGNHPVQQAPRRNFDGTITHQYVLTPGWDEELEEMLQELGGRLSYASHQAEVAGIPKRPKRQSTIYSLFKAGIKTTSKPYEW